MNTIEQYFTSTGLTWFEYNMGGITLIEFSLSKLIKRMLLNGVPLN
jgi:hypothetical protein